MKFWRFYGIVFGFFFYFVAATMPSAWADHARLGTVYVLEVEAPDPGLLSFLSQNDFDFDRVSGGKVQIYADKAEVAWLESLGVEYCLVEQQPNPPQFDLDAKGLGVYHSYASMVSELQAYATANPSITQLVNLGTSVLGRAIYALLITDNPGVEEDEPEFKYVANMHGDEVVGYEMCLYLIDLLLDKYGDEDTEGVRITDLVNESELWIVPTMNPDGHELGQRYNANGYDLNRYFPSWVDEGPYGNIYDGDSLGDTGRQKEIQVIMQWSAAHSFTLSANFHGGELVANYPYDENMNGDPYGGYSACPDDDLFIYLSETYTQYNLPMWNSTDFEHGITNGSAWYTVYGGMQDWNYLYLSDNEITLEISLSKTPSQSTLPTFWSQNKESMLSYLEAGHIGVRGVVRDADTGDPLYAKIEVTGNTQPVYTDPDAGDYHRPLLPGTYSITVSAPWHISQTITGIAVSSGAATRMDVNLLSVVSGGEVLCEQTLDGAHEYVPNGSTATGTATFVLTDPETVILRLSHNVQNATAAHVHVGNPGEAGAVLYNLGGPASPIFYALTLTQYEQIVTGHFINIHSEAYTGGEIRCDLNCVAGEGEGGEEGAIEGEGGEEGSIEGEGGEEGIVEGEGGEEGILEGEGGEEGILEGEGGEEGILEGEGGEEGILEGEGGEEGLVEGEGGEEGLVEGEGGEEGLVEGEGGEEGILEGEGGEEGILEGEGGEEGLVEGEGGEEGIVEGEGGEEGILEGEGGEEGILEGEGGEEGILEGEGGGEGVLEGEGSPAEGEGVSEGEGASEGEGIYEGEGGDEIHSADQNGDHQINLSELLRVIQFFNSGGYHCQTGTEDGFAPGAGDQTCAPHDNDYNTQDWLINLSELLRLIQFFNSGGYHACEGSEDGFCPGIYGR